MTDVVRRIFKYINFSYIYVDTKKIVLLEIVIATINLIVTAVLFLLSICLSSKDFITCSVSNLSVMFL